MQFSIPIPANRGARIDMFTDIMADIGDLQSVDGDLSTFSGHLVMCREMLTTIQRRMREQEVANEKDKAHFLVLLDEIGTGTDPNQVYRTIEMTVTMN